MLSRDERDQLISILWNWAEVTPDIPVAGFLEHGHLLTPRELAIAAEQGTPDGQALLEILEHGLRREGIELLGHRFAAAEASS
jgi:hypothetical protein